MKKASKEDQSWAPNLFIVGFPKCGSTALCEYLAQHKDVFVSDPKEPMTLFRKEELALWEQGKGHYFQDLVPLNQYKQIFKNASEKKYRVDGSQVYSRGGKEIAEKIKSLQPQAKCIFIIRDHKERVESAYNYFFPIHKVEDYDTYIKDFLCKDLESFLFLRSIEEYYATFGKNILVIDCKSLKEAPQRTLDKVFQWLDIPPQKVNSITANEAIIPKGETVLGRKLFGYYLNALDLLSKPIIFLFQKLHIYYGNRFVTWLKKNNPLIWARKIPSIIRRKNISEKKTLPEGLKSLLDKDYADTVVFCQQKNIYLGKEK